MTFMVVLTLAVGTYGLRLAGPLLHHRWQIPARVRTLLGLAAAALLTALMAVNALVPHGGFAGWALPAGVTVGGVAAWRRLPFVLVVLLAVATTAALRAFGVS
ncbi:MAG: AzlD domain-containing protein [Kutzneria sp.]|nr:AzlD domain-containing protein [Kutzneria sp.]